MGLKQSIRNAADAQALMGTAEGAIEEIIKTIEKINKINTNFSKLSLAFFDIIY